MILYSYFRSSASYRVRIALNVKGLSYEYRAVHLLKQGGEQHGDTYAELNPSREVPTLVHDGRVLGQSMAIIDYLDKIQPAPALFPADPFARALVVQACEIVNSGTQPLINLRVLNDLEKMFGADQIQKNAWANRWLSYGMTALETFVQKTAGDFCFGNAVTAADCFLMPQWATLDRFGVDAKPYPVLLRIRRNCETLAAFAKAAPGAQPDTPADAPPPG